MKNSSVIPIERIERAILLIRGEKAILDADLAKLYGVDTKRLNEQVKRNRGRFPNDFMFQLTKTEKAKVVANCDHLGNLRFSRTLPFAFTEHGAIMAANILNSQQAVETSVEVVRAFVRLRQIIQTNHDLARKLAEMEKKYDKQFKFIFDAIRLLMSPPTTPRKEIGFRPDSGK